MYEKHLTEILQHYYRDEHGKKSFRPLFLLNDLLRYWRTLCLNYEARRHDPQKPWRKKNVNLKFSRMVTVFSTVLPLVIRPLRTPDEMYGLCRMTAFDRLASAIDLLADEKLESEWPKIVDLYEEFLCWKEDNDLERHLGDGPGKSIVGENARKLSDFLYSALTHERIPPEFRRYLVL
jgi:hypothetical protein